MNIEIEKPIMIFRKDGEYGPMYSLGISNKKQDGTYETAYMNVRFRKGVEVNNREKILIKKAWIRFSKKDKNTYWYLFISEFKNLDKMTDSQIIQDVMETDDPFAEFEATADLSGISDSDLPFGE